MRPGLQRAHRLALCGSVVLDVLRLIDYHHHPFPFLELLYVRAHKTI